MTCCAHTDASPSCSTEQSARACAELARVCDKLTFHPYQFFQNSVSMQAHPGRKERKPSPTILLRSWETKLSVSENSPIGTSPSKAGTGEARGEEEQESLAGMPGEKEDERNANPSFRHIQLQSAESRPAHNHSSPPASEEGLRTHRELRCSELRPHGGFMAPALRATAAICQKINFPPRGSLWFSHNGTFKDLWAREF